MNHYWFFDDVTGEFFDVVADNIANALLAMYEKVFDGTAVHPLYVG